MTETTAIREDLLSATDLDAISADVSQGAGDFRWRALNALALFRLLLAVLLMATFASSTTPRFFGDLYPQLFISVLLGWFVLGTVGAVAGTRKVVPLRTLTEILLFIDVVAISALSLASGGITSGLAGLAIVFVAGGGLILNQLMALFVAALATMLTLAVQAYLNVSGVASLLQYPAAGVLCAIMFIAVVAIAPLAHRLAASEALAKRQTIDIANLAELNRYVVQHLREAIVVVDHEDRIRLLNDAAASHLGLGADSVGQALSRASTPLAHHVYNWRRGQYEEADEQTTMPGLDGSRLQVHIAPFAKGDAQRAQLLIFLEDISVLAERVQQGKLASLGRLSASIAHEIRNPIGAMSHAAQLLGERSADAELVTLSGIIERNATRVSDLVDDIMQMSRRDRSRPQQIILGQWLPEFSQDYAQMNGLEEGTLQLAGEEAITEIIFDPVHLRQVLNNLLDNARRHAGASAALPVVFNWGRAPGSRRPFLELMDHGPGVDENEAEQIFEPFYTRHDAGTGLGLYLCRELCELNRASLSYRRAEHGGSILHIVFADPSRWNGVG